MDRFKNHLKWAVRAENWNKNWLGRARPDPKFYVSFRVGRGPDQIFFFTLGRAQDWNIRTVQASSMGAVF